MINFPSFAVTPIISVKNGRVRIQLDRVCDRQTVVDIIDRVKDLTAGERTLYARINVLLILPKGGDADESNHG